MFVGFGEQGMDPVPGNLGPDAAQVFFAQLEPDATQDSGSEVVGIIALLVETGMLEGDGG